MENQTAPSEEQQRAIEHSLALVGTVYEGEQLPVFTPECNLQSEIDIKNIEVGAVAGGDSITELNLIEIALEPSELLTPETSCHTLDKSEQSHVSTPKCRTQIEVDTKNVRVETVESDKSATELNVIEIGLEPSELIELKATYHAEPEKTVSNSVETPNTTSPQGSIHHRQFLEKLLDIFNNRRSAVDSRATLVCTISLALFGFLITQGAQIFGGIPGLYTNIMICALLLPTFGAVAYSLSLVAPLRRPRKERRKIRKNLTWFYLIPEYSLIEYQTTIKSLTESELIDQTAKQVYELSVLLKARYDRLMYACSYLSCAIILFFICLIIKFILSIWSRGIV